jgi:group I intron endonuclease
METGIVYIHTCVITGRSYIGYTKRSIDERSGINANGYLKSKTTYFSKAIRKYGWKTFKSRIIVECSMDIIKDYEQYYIAHFNTFNNGYNGTLGGEGCVGPSPLRGRILSETTKQKISASLIGHKQSNETKEKRIISRRSNGKEWHTIETIDKIGKANKGKPVWITGVGHSNETKTKMSLNQPYRNPVEQIETGIIFNSISEAEYVMSGVRRTGGILKCVRGLAKTAFGYHWRYATN